MTSEIFPCIKVLQRYPIIQTLRSHFSFIRPFVKNIEKVSEVRLSSSRWLINVVSEWVNESTRDLLIITLSRPIVRVDPITKRDHHIEAKWFHLSTEIKFSEYPTVRSQNESESVKRLLEFGLCGFLLFALCFMNANR